MSHQPRHRSNLLWPIFGILLVIVMAISAYVAWWLPQTQHQPVTQSQTTQKPTQPASHVAIEHAASEAFVPTPNAVLIDESVLQEDIPTEPSLAKEEIAKQEDLQQQLQTQEKMLQQQNLTADELIRLKEQQIELLEAQLRQQAL